MAAVKYKTPRPAHHRPASLLKSMSMAPRKSLGQNFLTNEAVLQDIVSAARIDAADRVLEIGPGLGALTRVLLATGAQVVALEKDRGLAPHLQTVFQDNPRIQVHEADALKWDLSQLDAGEPAWRVVANLPYNVAIPILFHLLDAPRPFRDLHIMVQREVADRFVAQPGTSDYGAVGLQLAMRASVSRVLDVPPEAFHPAPKVWSTVVKVTPHTPDWSVAGSERSYRTVVRLAFGERRKTLRNALTSGLDRALVDALLEKTGLDGRRRGETLTVQEFCGLGLALEEACLAAGASLELEP